MYEIKKFLLFFSLPFAWGIWHYSGLELITFLITAASALTGYFAACKWIASAQAGKVIVEHELTDEEMRAQLKIQADYNINAAIYAALSAVLIVLAQMVPAYLWFESFINSH